MIAGSKSMSGPVGAESQECESAVVAVRRSEGLMVRQERMKSRAVDESSRVSDK